MFGAIPTGFLNHEKSHPRVIGITDLRLLSSVYNRHLNFLMSGVIILLDKCSNPLCAEPFRYLRQGRLFRVEGDPKMSSLRPTKSEYFWLCPSCAAKMTLRLDESASIRTHRVPDSLRPRKTTADFVRLDRREGWVLSSLDYIGCAPQPNWAPVHRGKLGYAR
jgi:hypothetical protein